MLIGFTIFSELVYLFLFFRARNLGLIDLKNDQDMFLVVGALTILFLVYFLAYNFLKFQKQKVNTIFLVCSIFHLTFLFIPFLTSNDLYSYIFTTRINSIFGENPYFVPYNNFPQDVLFYDLKTIWANHPTLYGPLFLQIGGFINLIDQNNLTFLTFAFKSLFIGANLLSAILIYKISKSKKAFFLFEANPLVVFELSGNSHTEAFIILFLLFSILFLYRLKVVGFFMFTASILIKYYSLILLPFYLIKLKKEGTKTLALSLLIGVLFTTIIYFPFWRGLNNFDYLLSYYNGQYISPSLFIYLGEIILGSYRLSFQLNTLVFLAVATFLTYKFWYSKSELKKFIFYSFLLYWVYLLTKSSLILSWYLTPLVALGSICIVWKEYKKYAVASLAFVSVYSLLLYYFVR